MNPVTLTTTCSENNGRRTRHVASSTARLAFRIDSEGEKALMYVKGALRGHLPGDVPSDSAIMRRALTIYRQHLGHNGVMAAEFHEVSTLTP